MTTDPIEALRQCAAQFRTYEAHHRAKVGSHHSDDRLRKAERNREMAEMCEGVLGAARGDAKAIDRRVSDLEAALSLALQWLGYHEPGDSRAVSDEFVAMAATQADLVNDEARSIITEALLRAKYEPSQMKRFFGHFLIFRKNGGRVPRFRHHTFASVETEALRLMDKHPESTFVIMQEVARVKNDGEPGNACRHCKGVGDIDHGDHPCFACGGTGVTPEQESGK